MKHAKSILSFTQEDINRFWSKVAIGDSNECWEFRAGKDYDGYGIFYAQRTSWRSNRIVVALTLRRDLGKDKQACHKCDNPSCCNPNHIYEGSDLDNKRDATERQHYSQAQYKRAAEHPETYLRGEDVHLAKLTEAEVLAIRKFWSEGYTIRSIQRLIPRVCWETVSSVVKNKTWKHLL